MSHSEWVCRNCKQTTQIESSGEMLIRCPQCSYAYPLSSPALLDGENLTEASLDDSTVATWVPVHTDRYQILRVLASGAQGKVFLAKHRNLAQLCVIKLVNAADDEWKEVAITRLRAEAQAGFRVSHHNVARVLDFDCLEDAWYFVMEFVDGVNLKAVLEKIGPLCAEQVAQIGRQAADGLHAIHRQGLIHRDIKPSNLILTPEGDLKITDLGLVKVKADTMDISATQKGQILGTPLYMAPEQFDSDSQIGFRADIYSLGATLFHILTGHPPHSGTGFLDIARMHREAPISWPATLRARLPEWFRNTIETCLAKNPKHRFATADDLAEALVAADREDGAKLSAAGGLGMGHSRGIAALTFKNLSKDPQHDWIGEAVADYTNNRLMEIKGLRLADRHALNSQLQRLDEDESEPTNQKILEAARLVGAGLVIAGSFQTTGQRLLISAHAIQQNKTEPKHLARVEGDAADLFALEDRLASAIIEALGHELSPAAGLTDARGTQSLEANELCTRGRRYFVEGKYSEAIKLAEQAIQIDPNYLEPISFIGACYGRLGQYDKALEYHRREETQAREHLDMPRLAEALVNTGVMYYYKGQYDEAYEFLEKARRIEAEIPMLPEAAKFRANLGFVLMRLERLEEAKAAFAEAIEHCRRMGDLVTMIWPYNGMGSVLLKLELHQQAKEYYLRALALSDELGDRVNVGISQMNLGRCACLMNRYDDADVHFSKALHELEQTSFWNGLTIVYEYLAEMRLIQERVDEALECIEKRVDLAQRHHNNRMEAEAWEQKARAFELINNTSAAMNCLKKSVEVSKRPAPFESLHRYLEEITSRKPFE